MKKRPITVRELAKEAGVSPTTISRVLSDPELVKESTRQRVIKIIEAHNYEPSFLSSNLINNRSKTIGVIIDEITNPFFVTIAAAIEAAVQTDGYTMMLSSSQWNEGNERRIARLMVRHRVSGIILAPINPDSETVKFICDQGIPVVLLNARSTNYAVDCVTTDNVMGGYLAGRHLISQDVSRLLLITGYEHQSIQDRVVGFRKSVDEAGRNVEEISYYTNVNTYADGHAHVAVLLARDDVSSGSSGVFVTNDNVAMGIIDGLLSHGIAVPDRVRVVGYDNVEFSARCRVPLTTIDQPQIQMGTAAATELLKKVNDHATKPEVLVFPPRLIVRESSGRG